MKVGNTNTIAEALSKSQALAQELENNQEELQQNFASGAIDSTDFLMNSIGNIHKSYCLSNGLPYGKKAE